jgi:hypothetical protein
LWTIVFASLCVTSHFRIMIFSSMFGAILFSYACDIPCYLLLYPLSGEMMKKRTLPIVRIGVSLDHFRLSNRIRKKKSRLFDCLCGDRWGKYLLFPTNFQ